MKVGDLVRIRDSDITGIVMRLDEPTPILPYQLVHVLFSDGTVDEYLSRHLEIICESR